MLHGSVNSKLIKCVINYSSNIILVLYENVREYHQKKHSQFNKKSSEPNSIRQSTFCTGNLKNK